MSGTSSYDKWLDSPFVRWNNALGEHFFSPRTAGQQVWLTCTPALLGEVGAAVGSDTAGLVSVLLAGPPWEPRPGELCRNALAASGGWRSRRHPRPPFPLHLGYLCLFAAAGATGDGATRVNAYYPRLRELARLPGTGTPPLFSRMTELWEDLERWSTADTGGTLGLFRAAGVGQQRHIGLPLAQNLITPAERRALPVAYDAAGLRSGPLPEPEELAVLLARTGTRGLARLAALLGTGTPQRDRELLLGLLSDSLVLWREQGPQRPEVPAAPAVPRAARAVPAALPERGRLALAARLDRAAGQFEVFLRLHLEPFPPVPVRLKAGAAVLSCDEQASGWSTPLADPAGSECRADTLDWAGGATFSCAELGFRAALPGGGLRVLKQGLLHGLPHLLETHELEAGQRAVLLVSGEAWPAVRAWGAADAGWQELHVSGLPDGWRLASAGRCPELSPLRPLLPWLPGPAAPRLVFDGGLRCGGGARHSYLDYARPTVRLTGGTGCETLTAGGVPLPADADGRHQLPPGLPPGRHTVRAHAGGEVAAEAHLVLSGGPWARPAAQPPSAPRPPVQRWAGRRDLLLAPGLWQLHLDGDRRAQAVTLLTRDGQADTWLSTARPPAGSAVWAIPEGRHAQAVYVGGGDPTDEQPLPDRPSPAWLALLAGTDPRAGAVQPPSDHSLAGLWQLYEAAARAYW